MCPGVAQYSEEGKDPYRILIEEETIKNMNPTFQGKPVYVEHVDEVDLTNLQNDADGYVIDSFYNQSDGKCWVKFIVVSDKGKQAIRNGWKLSNAYIPKSFGEGGLWHGVPYIREIRKAEYEHLAIVKNPRYEESMIKTPDEFKKYNEEKEVELKRLANSKQGEKQMGLGLKFFKKAKVENSVDLESTVVELPKSKREISISDLVSEMDKIENMHGYANEEHMVKCGAEEMSVKDLIKRHMSAMNELADLKKMHDGSDEHEEKEKDLVEKMANDPEEKSTIEEGTKDVDGRGGDKHLNADEAKTKNEAKEKAEALRNAGPHLIKSPVRIDLSMDQVARGKARYGSK